MHSNLRRLAADHAALHTSPLPPNYLFPPNTPPSSDLTSLTLLLAGPTGTPYAAGLFRLHLSIPPSYPTTPPAAHFRTRIFHPNIDERTGAVCVDTLKRDWSADLTLRDVLVAIGCLLVCPNAESALNEEAGRLVREDWGAFERRVRSMVRVWATVPAEMEGEVREARGRGEENGAAVVVDEDEESRDVMQGTRTRETSTVIMKKKKKKSQCQVETQFQTQSSTAEEEESKEYDSSSSTKENGSPIKHTSTSSPRKQLERQQQNPPSPSPSPLKKRPLSVLETDIEPEYILIPEHDDNESENQNENERNIAANNNKNQSQKAGGQGGQAGPLRKSPKLGADQSPRRLHVGSGNGGPELDMSTLFTSPIRSGSGSHSNVRPMSVPGLVPVPAPGMAGWTAVPTFSSDANVNHPGVPSLSVPSSALNSKARTKPRSKPKPRVGVRRL